MALVRRTMLLTILAVGCLLAPAAQAAQYDPGGFRFQSSQLYVHENAGYATITIERGDTSQEAQIRYITGGIGFDCGGTMCSATQYDFTSGKAMLDFPAGVAQESFQVPIVDHGGPGIPKTISVVLFGPYPIGLADPNKAVLTIVNDDPMLTRDPSNPLGLTTVPAGGDPLAGAQFFVDPDSPPARAAQQDPRLNVIASQPQTARFGAFSWPDPGLAVQDYLERAAAEQPGTVPMMATYRIVHGGCGNYADSPADQAAYHDFALRFAQGIGNYRGVLFFEMDSLITSGCLSHHGLTVRMGELRDALNILITHCPRLVIYLDAGAADAYPPARTAFLLNWAGVSLINGFFLNATHFDWTSKEIAYGNAISRLTGGKHFVVNTGENGQGPLAPPDIAKDGNEVLCSPWGRGLGPKPTANTGYPNADAFAWTSNPGESDGSCGGRYPTAPAPGSYWTAYALMLIQNAVFHVDGHHWGDLWGRGARASRGHRHHHARHRHRHTPVRLWLSLRAL